MKELVKLPSCGKTVLVEIKPGESLADLPAEIKPPSTFCRWLPVGAGYFRPEFAEPQNWIRATHALLYGVHMKPEHLVRLGNAGFIDIAQVSPGCTMVLLESILAHIERCKDPAYWTEARAARCREGFWNFRTAV
jgi:hypothetical protein